MLYKYGIQIWGKNAAFNSSYIHQSVLLQQSIAGAWSLEWAAGVAEGKAVLLLAAVLAIAGWKHLWNYGLWGHFWFMLTCVQSATETGPLTGSSWHWCLFGCRISWLPKLILLETWLAFSSVGRLIWRNVWLHEVSSQQREGIRKAWLRKGERMEWWLLPVAQSHLGLIPRESACQGRVTCYSLSHVNGLLPPNEKNLVPLFLALLMLDLVIVQSCIGLI